MTATAKTSDVWFILMRVEKLALSIKAGGAGKWGPVPMPPPTSLSDADATKLAVWILEGAK